MLNVNINYMVTTLDALREAVKAMQEMGVAFQVSGGTAPATKGTRERVAGSGAKRHPAELLYNELSGGQFRLIPEDLERIRRGELTPEQAKSDYEIRVQCIMGRLMAGIGGTIQGTNTRKRFTPVSRERLEQLCAEAGEAGEAMGSDETGGADYARPSLPDNLDDIPL